MEHLSLEVMRSFVSIVELQGFNRAAEKVHLTQSAISMQIKKLESQVGQALFDRRGKQWLLTNQGEVLLSYARRMLELNDEVLGAMKETRLKGRVRIGVQADLMASKLPASIYRFIKSQPAVLVELKADTSDALQSQLVAGKLDVAVYLGIERNSRLDTQVLGSLPLQWIGPAAYSGFMAGASPLPLAVLGPECKMRQAASAALTQAGMPWRIAFQSAHLPAMLGAVAAGIGISVRTKMGLPDGVKVIPGSARLPALPTVQVLFCMADKEDRRAVLACKQFLAIL